MNNMKYNTIIIENDNCKQVISMEYKNKNIITNLTKSHIGLKYINEDSLKKMSEGYKIHKPYKYIVIDNFLKEEYLEQILHSVKKLKDNNATSKFVNSTSEHEYNKFCFSKIDYLDTILQDIFTELSSNLFIEYIEKLTKIYKLIKNVRNLKGAGIHRVRSGGYLDLHADFNMYRDISYGVIDRRINLLIYLNPEWKDIYNGHFLIADLKEKKIVNKISPLLNRCVIFDTIAQSIHGHPETLNTPPNVNRESIAAYYYTKNVNNMKDFENNEHHTTTFYNYEQFL